MYSEKEEKHVKFVIDLGTQDSKEAKSQLIQNLSTLNSFVRDAVVESLVKIGDVDFLCKNMNNGHRYVRRGIVQALGIIGGNKAYNQIIESLEDEEWGVRMYAAEALGNSGESKYSEFLKKLLTDIHEWPREEAKRALNKLN